MDKQWHAVFFTACFFVKIYYVLQNTSLTYREKENIIMRQLTVQETPIFIKSVKDKWSDEEREEFINWISVNYLLGDVMPGYGGLRKVRWKSQSKGKRSGTRVIYFNKLNDGKVVLLIAYQKSEFDNLSENFLKRLREEMMK